MKHTNVNELLKAIINIEKADLGHALEANGGTFTPDEGNRPSVEFYGGNGPCSADVVKAVCTRRNGDNSMRIVITVKDDKGESFDITPEDCYAGSISNITASI